MKATGRSERYGGLQFGSVAVLHAVLDTVVDSCTEASVQVRSDLTALERRVFSPDREDLTEEIYSLKREVVEFRHAVQPLAPVVQDFAGAHAGWPQNDDMLRISASAAILASPTLIVGIYGMNFAHMPELNWTYCPVSAG
ncbi:magnesium and cobalt transporter CorA [Streptomyces himastatinicus ATCC 53653]|uniref:Magnesium and cobalt transporter CorA n=1 Tax=Streptomyces himastatinicus ATCC 53653 TaxID=457427 RepID=D9W5Y0_9ACTN|nr:CorA family divalent cation transporter [Streptomyces himastatinicus]EFL20336.1 magnesium and cobalt transporter CorA [Streptomyces himastatinicus ATCC 53653]